MLRTAPSIIAPAVALLFMTVPALAVPLMLDAQVNVNPAIDTTAEIEAKRELFEEYDADNDGYLAKSEAEAMPSVEKGVFGADDFARIDNDSDGEVDFQEFATYLNTDDAQIARFKRNPGVPTDDPNADDEGPESESAGDGR